MFFKILKFDLRNSFLKAWLMCLIAFLIFIFADVVLWVLCGRLVNNSPELSAVSLTLGDVLLYTTGGAKHFLNESTGASSIPILWLSVILLLAFMTLNIIPDGLSHLGKHALVLSGNRKLWWFSKCVLLMIYVVFYYLLFIVSAVIFTLCFGAELTLDTSEFIPRLFMLSPERLTPLPWNLLPAFLLHILAAFTLVLLQTALTLYINPVVSFLSVSMLLVLSVFFSSPLFVGNLAMVLRSECITMDRPISLALGFGLCSLLCIALIGVGLFRVSRMDILTKEEQYEN